MPKLRPPSGWNGDGGAGTPATVLCDGDDGLARLQREVLPGGTVVLDWWQAAVRREHVAELLGHPERNAAALAHYAARRRRGEPIATSFVESAVARSSHGAWPRRSRRARAGPRCRHSSPCAPPC